MKKFIRKFYKATFGNRFITPVIEFKPLNIWNYFGFWKDYLVYRFKRRLFGPATITMRPILGEKTKTTEIDPHYFYQGAWAFEKILKSGTDRHVDVGSQVSWVGLVSRVVKTQFVDIRPLVANLDNLQSIQGSILDLPFLNGSVESLSCLHVAEHIGLGRYGDPLDPQGTIKACRELARVLAPEGNLYFSLPIGRERIEFNAHRIHDPGTILTYFNNLNLVEFSAVDDRGNYVRNADIHQFENARYSCGLFHLCRK